MLAKPMICLGQGQESDDGWVRKATERNGDLHAARSRLLIKTRGLDAELTPPGDSRYQLTRLGECKHAEP